MSTKEEFVGGGIQSRLAAAERLMPYVILLVFLFLVLCDNVYDPELHRKLWGWSLTLEARDAYPILQVYSGSVSCIR